MNRIIALLLLLSWPSLTFGTGDIDIDSLIKSHCNNKTAFNSGLQALQAAGDKILCTEEAKQGPKERCACLSKVSGFDPERPENVELEKFVKKAMYAAFETSTPTFQAILKNSQQLARDLINQFPSSREAGQADIDYVLEICSTLPKGIDDQNSSSYFYGSASDILGLMIVQETVQAAAASSKNISQQVEEGISSAKVSQEVAEFGGKKYSGLVEKYRGMTNEQVANIENQSLKAAHLLDRCQSMLESLRFIYPDSSGITKETSEDVKLYPYLKRAAEKGFLETYGNQYLLIFGELLKRYKPEDKDYALMVANYYGEYLTCKMIDLNVPKIDDLDKDLVKQYVDCTKEKKKLDPWWGKTALTLASGSDDEQLSEEDRKIYSQYSNYEKCQTDNLAKIVSKSGRTEEQVLMALHDLTHEETTLSEEQKQQIIAAVKMTPPAPKSTRRSAFDRRQSYSRGEKSLAVQRIQESQKQAKVLNELEKVDEKEFYGDLKDQFQSFRHDENLKNNFPDYSSPDSNFPSIEGQNTATAAGVIGNSASSIPQYAQDGKEIVSDQSDKKEDSRYRELLDRIKDLKGQLAKKDSSNPTEEESGSEQERKKKKKVRKTAEESLPDEAPTVRQREESPNGDFFSDPTRASSPERIASKLLPAERENPAGLQSREGSTPTTQNGQYFGTSKISPEELVGLYAMAYADRQGRPLLAARAVSSDRKKEIEGMDSKDKVIVTLPSEDQLLNSSFEAQKTILAEIFKMGLKDKGEDSLVVLRFEQDDSLYELSTVGHFREMLGAGAKVAERVVEEVQAGKVKPEDVGNREFTYQKLEEIFGKLPPAK